jgi:hypothetical protein
LPTPAARAQSGAPALRILRTVAVVLGVFTLNFFYPVVRFKNDLVNYRVAFVVLLLPWLAVVAALWLRPLWLKLTATAGWLLVAVVCLPGAAFLWFLEIPDVVKHGVDRGFTPVCQVEMLGSVIRSYETNGGATTAFGLVVRQEKTLLPGVLLVRTLYREYRALGGCVHQEGADSVRVNPYSEPTGKEGPLVFRVRRNVWF